MNTISSFDFNLIWNAVTVLLFQLLTLGACTYYVYMKRSTDGILMTIGSLIHFFTGIFYSLILPLYGTELLNSMSYNFFLSMVRVISFLGSVFFTIGFIMLIVNYLAVLKREQDQFKI